MENLIEISSLHEGYSVDDANNVIIVPDFLQNHLNVCPGYLHDRMLEIPIYERTETLVRGILKRVPGSHPFMHNRGRPVNFDRIWLQKNYDEVLLRYGYSGLQWGVANATCRIEDMAEINDIVNAFNLRFKHNGESFNFNHAMYNFYENGQQYLKYHSDADADLAADSVICVIKTGRNARTFGCRYIGESQDFFQRDLTPGTLILMTREGNNQMLHGVPRAHGDNGRTGSLVMRNVKKKLLGKR